MRAMKAALEKKKAEEEAERLRLEELAKPKEEEKIIFNKISHKKKIEQLDEVKLKFIKQQSQIHSILKKEKNNVSSRDYQVGAISNFNPMKMEG